MEMQEFLSQVMLDVAMAAVTLLVAYAISGLRKVTKKIQNEEQRGLLVGALEDLETLTTKTVASIEQTTAKALREAVKNGTRSKEDLVALSERAFNEISATLSLESQDIIRKNFGNFSSYLTKAIETKVLELKRTSP